MNMNLMPNSNQWRDTDLWSQLISHGDGRLTPEQRQVFERAIHLVIDQLRTTLSKPDISRMSDSVFLFPRYIENMESRLMYNAGNKDELKRDATLTACRVIEKIAGQLLRA